MTLCKQAMARFGTLLSRPASRVLTLFPLDRVNRVNRFILDTPMLNGLGSGAWTRVGQRK